MKSTLEKETKINTKFQKNSDNILYNMSKKTSIPCGGG